jgi:hypothetical protein
MLQALRSSALNAQLTVARIRPLPSFALALFIAAATVQMLWLPEMREQRDAGASELRTARSNVIKAKPAKSDRPHTVDDRWIAFNEMLGDASHGEEQVRTLFATAQATGLTLAEGDYRISADKSGLLQELEVVIPLKGSYSQVRSFCEQVLVSVPFGALDAVQIKRENAATDVVEAKLRLTFYLRAASALNRPRKP